MEISRPSLPKGGGAIKGIGETFQPNAFTGTASLSIPIPATPCRGVAPQLSLDYSSGSGNGVFGLGWSLSVPNISRKTSKGIPKYDGSDIFLLSNAEDLVPVAQAPRCVSINALTYYVSIYRPRIEGLFAKIERWAVQGSGDSFWRVISKDNVTSVYGASPRTRIADPKDPSRVFQWLLQETCDDKGNRTIYEYRGEIQEDVPNNLCEKNRVQFANRYLARIKYGNGPPALTPAQRRKRETIEFGTEPSQKTGSWEQRAWEEARKQGIPEPTWHFEMIFDYGDHTIEPEAKAPYFPPTESTRPPPRSDPFSAYHAGFEIRTRWLCRSILMFHHFPAEFGTEERVLTHATRFHYSDPAPDNTISKPEEATSLSKLSSVESIGLRRRKDGIYATRKLPPLTFDYTLFEPTRGSFEPFLTGGPRSLPGVESHPYQLVDLYGEGIPGVLYADGDTLLYWESEGAMCLDTATGTSAVRYAPPRQPHAFPVHRDVGTAAERLMDLTGNGQLDLLVSSTSGAGYYQVEPDHGWQGFQALPAVPTDFADPDSQLMDFTGDGLSDLVRIEHDRVQVYPGLGKYGFGPSKSVQRTPGLPWPTRSGPREAVRFADMFGTGGQHLVQITSGQVTCWPHLGYGRFAEPVQFENAPRIASEFNPARLSLVDLDGSGTADLVYAHDDRVEIWLNQCGNGFAKKSLTLALPAPCSSGAQLTFADVLGTGTTALVFSDNRARPRHWYLDLSQGRKAHLLNAVDNHLGATSAITYASSTKFYLADKRAGRPWLTRLPFPVQVVEKVEIEDAVAGTHLLRTYAYRHGYYDGEEREFRGFGSVERRDAETLSAAAAHTDVPPVVTRTWYHTGAWVEGNAGGHYRAEYYAGDAQAAQLTAGVLEPDLGDADGETLRHAQRALHGSVLREEVYSEDPAGAVGQDPYTAMESSFVVRAVQARAPGRDPILFIHPGETISYHYEREADDPRVEHAFTVEVDEYGHTLRSCHVSYPRRDPHAEHPEQRRLEAVARLDSLLNVDALTSEEEHVYLVGIPWEERSFEIGGLQPAPGRLYVTRQEVKDGLDAALRARVAFDQEMRCRRPGAAVGDTKQARLLSCRRYFYWDESQRAPLAIDPERPVFKGVRALVHHVEEAAFSDAQIRACFGKRLRPGMLERDGGYIAKPEANVDHWWSPGVVHRYHGGERFFLLHCTEEPFGGGHAVAYDIHALAPVRVSDALGNATSADIDYLTLTPFRVTDINGNATEARYDALGRVVATSVYGTQCGEPRGDMPIHDREGATPAAWKDPADIEDMLADPHGCLQQATSFHAYFHDAQAWRQQRRPACTVDIVRETHVRDLADNQISELQITIVYTDGLGRVVQTKTNDDPVPPEGETEKAPARWLCSGRTVYNNKGKVVKQYEPFHTGTVGYEDDPALTEHGVTSIHHYDPLLRPIKVETPAGRSTAASGGWDYYFSEVRFTPWRLWRSDANATVNRTPRYAHRERLDDDQRAALVKAAKHAGAATVVDLDSRGRPFLTHQMLAAADEEAQWLTTHLELDIQGREISSTDPRLFRLNADRQKAQHEARAPLRSFRHTCDMGGALLFAESADAGKRWTLPDVLGRPVHRWDDRGTTGASDPSASTFHHMTRYDKLHRPLAHRLQEGDVIRVVEKMLYGDKESDAPDDRARAASNNLIGRLVQHHDQAGVVHFESYDIGGRPSANSRRLLSDYKNMVDWGDTHPGRELPSLEAEHFESHWTYDALGRVIREIHPDGGSRDGQNHGSESVFSHDRRGALQTLAVTFARDEGACANAADPTQLFVRHTEHNARGQRTRIDYGNGVTTRHAYDLATFQVSRITTERATVAAAQLQDLRFTHDPAGNPVQVRDLARCHAPGTPPSVDPLNNYTYDALHRLVRATGREHAALTWSGLGHHARHADDSVYANLNDRNLLRRYARSFRYDEASNLTTITHRQVGSRRRCWPCNHRSSHTRKLSLSATSNRAVPVGWTEGGRSVDSFFDRHGNQTTLDRGREVRWNFRDHIGSVILVARQNQDSDAEYYVYDASGARIRKVRETKAAGGTRIEEIIYLGRVEIKRTRLESGQSSRLLDERRSLHVFDGVQRIAVSHRWTRQRAATHKAPGRHLTRQSRYQIDNHVGTTALELDDEGSILSYEEYYPYGGSAFAAGDKDREVTRKEYRYSGKEQDDATGLYYYGARYYAPWLGRWMSPDPAGTIDGLNLYGFVSGNPIVFMDHGGQGRFLRMFGCGLIPQGERSPEARGANLVRPTDPEHTWRMISPRPANHPVFQRGSAPTGGVHLDFEIFEHPVSIDMGNTHLSNAEDAVTNRLVGRAKDRFLSTEERADKRAIKQAWAAVDEQLQEAAPTYARVRNIAQGAGAIGLVAGVAGTGGELNPASVAADPIAMVGHVVSAVAYGKMAKMERAVGNPNELPAAGLHLLYTESKATEEKRKAIPGGGLFFDETAQRETALAGAHMLREPIHERHPLRARGERVFSPSAPKGPTPMQTGRQSKTTRNRHND